MLASRPIIQVSGIRKTYGQTVAVDDVSFEVLEGEIFGLIGPNGAGKTTTMECVEGFRSPDRADVPLVSFGIALLFSTWAVLSIGFLVASLVPSARFAQPVAALVLYPMLALSGLFFALDRLPPALEALSLVVPLRYAVSLLDGVWRGEPWLAHLGDLAGLTVIFVVVSALSARFFRWE